MSTDQTTERTGIEQAFDRWKDTAEGRAIIFAAENDDVETGIEAAFLAGARCSAVADMMAAATEILGVMRNLQSVIDKEEVEK